MDLVSTGETSRVSAGADGLAAPDMLSRRTLNRVPACGVATEKRSLTPIRICNTAAIVYLRQDGSSERTYHRGLKEEIRELSLARP